MTSVPDCVYLVFEQPFDVYDDMLIVGDEPVLVEEDGFFVDRTDALQAAAVRCRGFCASHDPFDCDMEGYTDSDGLREHLRREERRLRREGHPEGEIRAELWRRLFRHGWPDPFFVSDLRRNPT